MKESTVDEATGRLKEAAGALTDDEDLEAEGRADQLVADVKDEVDDLADTAREAVDTAREMAEDVKDRITG